MNIILPPPVLYAIRLLNASGFEAYAVGGCVRDSLLGREPSDWDITTSALPHQTAAIFADYRTVETGIRHGTLTVLLDSMPLEITTYRLDGTYTDSRHPDTVSFTRSLTEDLRRRDFTINAMAYHPTDGLIDPFGGSLDLEKMIIRCVGDPIKRFREDALRIMRALRFSSVLGFTIDLDTEAALRLLAPTLSSVSAQRITSELQSLLCGKHAANILSVYADAFSAVLPEIGGVYDYSLLTNTRPLFIPRLAALFRLAGLDATDTTRVLTRLHLDNRTVRSVALLLSAPRVDWQSATVDPSLLHLLNELGANLIFDYLDINAYTPALAQRVRQLLADKVCYHISMLEIDGNDLIQHGITAGPEIGKTLHMLLEAVMNGTCLNTKKDLLSYALKKEPVP